MESEQGVWLQRVTRMYEDQYIFNYLFVRVFSLPDKYHELY